MDAPYPSTFRLEPFQPPRVWRNPHVQTVLANLRRSETGVVFRRVRLDTPDGDFLDLDFTTVPAWPVPEASPLVLLLHGLEGSARSGYAYETYRQLARLGVRAVGLNFRSCSGEMNRTARLYHAGETQDLAFVLKWLRQRFPHVPLGAVGFSLGANVLLKYLGEQGSHAPVIAAAAVSPPFDLAASSETFISGNGRFYGRLFLRTLREKVRRHGPIVRHKVNLTQALGAATVKEFDETVTAPLHGFRDAADYYARSSSGQYLDLVRVPTLLLRALDDPFFANDIPHVSLTLNPCLVDGVVPHGGHVGFVTVQPPRQRHYWAERQAARFLAWQLSTPV